MPDGTLAGGGIPGPTDEVQVALCVALTGVVSAACAESPSEVAMTIRPMQNMILESTVTVVLPHRAEMRGPISASLVPRAEKADHDVVEHRLWRLVAPTAHEVVCHNDRAPYSAVFRNGSPVAMLDWDMPGPGEPRVGHRGRSRR